METTLAMIEYFQIMTFFSMSHQSMSAAQIPKLMADALEKHTTPTMVKALVSAIYSFGNHIVFID